MSNIFEKTPFKSYDDVVAAVKDGSVTISYDRSAAYNVGTKINTICFFTFPIGFLLSAVTIGVFAYITNNYWILIATPALLILQFIIVHLKVLVVIAVIGGIAGYILGIPLWIVSLLISIVILYIGYSIWWGITSSIVHNELIKNESLFSTMWKDGVLALKDDSGNFYLYKAS